MTIRILFGRTRRATFEGPPSQVLIGLAMVLFFGIALALTVAISAQYATSATRVPTVLAGFLTEAPK